MLGAALRFAVGTATVAAGGWALRALQGAPAAVGRRPGEIGRVAKQSPNYRDGVFVNIDPALAGQPGPGRAIRAAIIRELVGSRDSARPAQADPVGRCRRTWHHAARPRRHLVRPLVGADRGRRLPRARRPGVERAVLAVADRRAPSGCTRCRLPLEALPALDAVIISHDHYDHLDIDTIVSLARTQRAHVLRAARESARTCATGDIPDGAHRRTGLERERASIGDLTLVCTPARHFSGRFLTRNTTLWSSWAIIGPRHRAFFGGDTGYTQELRRDRRRSRAVRPDADAGRGLPLRLAGHPHESRGSGACAPSTSPTRQGLLRADPLGDVPAGAASVVRARRTVAGRRRAGGRRRWRCRGRGSASTDRA